MNIELTKELAAIIKMARADQYAIRTYKRRGRSMTAYLLVPSSRGATRDYIRIGSQFDELLKLKLIYKPDIEKPRGYTLYDLTDLGKSIVIPDLELLPGSPLDLG